MLPPFSFLSLSLSLVSRKILILEFASKKKDGYKLPAREIILSRLKCLR